MCICMCTLYVLYVIVNGNQKATQFVIQYPIPMKKETQGKTDLCIGTWLQSQPRDKVALLEFYLLNILT